MGFIEEMIEMMVPLCAILLPVFIIWVILDSSRKKEKERNALINKMIDKGEDPEKIMSLIETSTAKKKEVEKSPAKHFKSGITMLSIGLGFILTELLSGWGTMGIGAFIGIIGFGELAVAWYLRKYSK